MGTYGPGIAAGSGLSFSGAKTPIKGLLRCGDSTNPGIGVPAVASSGAVAANAILSLFQHWKLLDKISF
jgi:phytoene dehydrogenase-like protein